MIDESRCINRVTSIYTDSLVAIGIIRPFGWTIPFSQSVANVSSLYSLLSFGHLQTYIQIYIFHFDSFAHSISVFSLSLSLCSINKLTSFHQTYIADYVFSFISFEMIFKEKKKTKRLKDIVLNVFASLSWVMKLPINKRNTTGKRKPHIS